MHARGLQQSRQVSVVLGKGLELQSSFQMGERCLGLANLHSRAGLCAGVGMG